MSKPPVHVIDYEGLVWRVVRDGGMATRADFTGITSIGIDTLRQTRGPLLFFDALAYRAEATSPAALRSAAEAVVLAATTHTPEIAALNAVLARAASPAALDVPTDLLESLVEDEECRFDHHGGCQAHGYLSLEPGERCPQAELKAIIRARLAQQDGTGE